ncbi:MAG TPA: complex I NDUFA9 subunit family protein [Thermomicrobiales bacterium]|nr:complex I NDUFA9 subunit family protein [Thermomicrobiales bacterium]
MARILITGGTGFVGSEIRKALADRELRLLVRDPSSVRDAGAAELVRGDVLDPASLEPAMAGVDAVIHLVAIIEESGDKTFDLVIRQGSENVVTAARNAGVRRLVHMSALGAQPNPAYPYLNAKWGAEQAVRQSGLEWTIIRPSVIFGPRDGFVNVLAGLIRRAPIIPVVGSGESKFQPVAVGEVAAVYRAVLDDPTAIGQTYELGGGETYSYEEMLDVIAAQLGKRKPKLHLPVGLMRTVVALSSPLPKSLRPPVTKEQLNMLALDNCTDQSATAALIGRQPIALRDGLEYLSQA